MNLNHISYFVDLSTTLSFTATARNLKIAQPAVSRAISNLELELGFDLFYRNNKNVSLTNEGKNLASLINMPFASMMESISEISNSAKMTQGKISIGSLPELGEYKVIPLLQSFLKHFPDIEVEVIYAGNKELKEKFKNGELDFIFSIGKIDQENIRTYPLIKQNSYLLTSSKNVDKLASIEDREFILYRQNDPLLDSYLSSFYPKYSTSRIKKKMVLNSHDSIVAMLKDLPRAYAVLPELSEAVAKSLKDQSIKIASKQKLATTIYFSFWVQESAPRRFKEFQNFTRSYFKV